MVRPYISLKREVRSPPPGGPGDDDVIVGGRRTSGRVIAESWPECRASIFALDLETRHLVRAAPRIAHAVVGPSCR